MIGLRLSTVKIFIFLQLVIYFVDCFEIDLNDKKLQDLNAKIIIDDHQNEVTNNLKSSFFKKNESDQFFNQRDFLKQNLVQLILESNDTGFLSSKCSNKLKEYKSNLTIGTTWAFKSNLLIYDL